MALHLEFVVLGPPVSNQQSTPAGRVNLTTWRATVAGAATLAWPNPPLAGDLKAIILNFYAGNAPSVDVDNFSKPILDAIQGRMRFFPGFCGLPRVPEHQTCTKPQAIAGSKSDGPSVKALVPPL